MVGRVIEGVGGAPLTNEIKIFKHCFMTLLVPLGYLAAAPESRTPSGIGHHSYVISQPTTFVLTGLKAGDMGQIPALPLPPQHHHQLHLVSFTIVFLSPVKPSETWILLAAQSARLYISSLLFIVAALVSPLTTSFCNHHVTMKDAGFKSPSLQHPLSQLASSNQ